MENVNSKIKKYHQHMTDDKNKISFEEIEKREIKQFDEINERLKKKDYVLTVFQTGDISMSNGDHEREVTTRRFYVVCSLEEIPEYIQYMKQPFWSHDKNLTEKEIKNYPSEKKRWGRYYNVVIEPLSEEMEKDYVGSSKNGFFKSWRRIQKMEEKGIL
jgi:hypothetical protein